MACVKSVFWPALVSNVVDVSLPGGSLGYWTACNNVERYCTVPYCGHTSQYHGWLTCFSFHVNRPPRSWDKAISDADLETPRSMSWVWSKGKVIQSSQNHINSLTLHFKSIRPTSHEIQLFRIMTLKHLRSRSWVRSKVKVTYYTKYATYAFHFRFTLIGPTVPEIWPK